MADFNQSPAGQTSVAASISIISIGVGATAINIADNQPSSSVVGTSGTLNLAATVVAPTGMYPAWRRSLRVISDD
jgi:hypothetical protein